MLSIRITARFVGLLIFLFVGLKLGEVIDWSWWWVLSPLWISWGLILGILGFAVVIWMAIKK
jgi:hypothetical protein